MPTVGLIEGLTSALGDELTALGGVRSTRLSVQVDHERVTIDYGAVTETEDGSRTEGVSSNAAGTTITLDGGAGAAVGTSLVRRAFSPDIASGHRFRCLTESLFAPTVSDQVSSRLSDTQIALSGGVFDATLTGASWEVYDASKVVSLQVESTHGWADSGQIVVRGKLCRYSGKTATSLLNVELFNGEVWTYQVLDASEAALQVGEEVVDYTRVYSAVDTMRRSFLLDYATGDDLDTIGFGLGVRRPTTADDALFRKVVRAVAYSPRGTMWVIELLLDAVFGAGNYEVFEDLTQGGGLPGVGQPHVRFDTNHPAEVFIRGPGSSSSSAGKTFVEEIEHHPLSTSQSAAVTLDEPPIRVVGLRLASEGDRHVYGSLRPASGRPWLVSAGQRSTGTVTASVNGVATEIQVDAPSGAFPSGIPLRGDDFLLVGSAGLPGRVGAVKQRVSDSQLLLGDITGAPGLEIRQGWSGLEWEIRRDKTDMRFSYLPSKDVRFEKSMRSQTARQIWEYRGADIGDPAIDPAAESKYALIQTDSSGTYLRIAEPPSQDAMAWYRMDARVVAESDATFEALIRIRNAASSTGVDRNQFSMRMSDGDRLYAVGVEGAAGGATRVGFYDPTSAGAPWLTSPSGAHTIAASSWATVEISKRRWEQELDRPGGAGGPGGPGGGVGSGGSAEIGVCTLSVDGHVVERHGLSAFPSVLSLPSGERYERSFGNRLGSQVGVLIDVKHVAWSAATPRDDWSLIVPSGQVTQTGALTGSGVSGTGAFASASAGDYVRITSASRVHATYGGDARGERVIDTVTSPTQAVATGSRTRYDATVDPSDTLRIRIEDDPRAFAFPSDLGNQVEMLSGPDSGTKWRITALLNSLDGSVLSAAGRTNAARVEPVAGGGATLTIQERSSWRLLFTGTPDDPNVRFAVVAQGSVAAQDLSLPEAFRIPLYTGASGPLVEVEYTRVLSAQVVEESAENDLNVSPGYDYYPFYLYDDLGWARGILDVITAAGVWVNLHSFTRDASGPHIK